MAQENGLLSRNKRLSSRLTSSVSDLFHTMQMRIDSRNVELRKLEQESELTLLFAFLPLLALPGESGNFIRGLPLAVTFTVTASLIVALTVTPAMCRYLLRGKLGGKHEDRDGFLVRLLKRVYEPTLRAATIDEALEPIHLGVFGCEVYTRWSTPSWREPGAFAVVTFAAGP